MSFSALRHELHQCCNLDEITGWLLSHASPLCATYDCATPINLSSSRLESHVDDWWSFILWTQGDGVFCDVFIDRVLVALGFHVTWTAKSFTPQHGCDSHLVMIKHEWPIMQFYETLTCPVI